MLILYIVCCNKQKQDQNTIEYNTVTSEIEKASESGNKWNAYRKHTSQEHYEIRKYAAENGNSSAVSHFKSN